MNYHYPSILSNYESYLPYRYFVLYIVVVLVLGCNNAGDYPKLFQDNHNLITAEDLRGEYKGSISEDDGDYTSALILKIKEDGTFTSQRFTNGKVKENTKGTYATRVEKFESKDAYGKKLPTKYSHYVTFVSDDNKDQKSEYLIIDGFYLSPVKSFLDYKIGLHKGK